MRTRATIRRTATGPRPRAVPAPTTPTDTSSETNAAEAPPSMIRQTLIRQGVIVPGREDRLRPMVWLTHVPTLRLRHDDVEAMAARERRSVACRRQGAR
jgi:hypothetical protein